MKTTKKPRAQSADLRLLTTTFGEFYVPIPLDSKDRAIPSSVGTLYSCKYFSYAESEAMVRSL